MKLWELLVKLWELLVELWELLVETLGIAGGHAGDSRARLGPGRVCVKSLGSLF